MAAVILSLAPVPAFAWAPQQYTTSAEEELPTEVPAPEPQVEVPESEPAPVSAAEASCSTSSSQLSEVNRNINQLGSAITSLTHPYPASCYSQTCRKVIATRSNAPPVNLTGVLSSGLQGALRSQSGLSCATPGESAKQLIDGYLGSYSMALRGDTCALLSGAMKDPQTLVPTLNYLETSLRDTATACFPLRPANRAPSQASTAAPAPELPAEAKESRLLMDTVRQLLRLRTQIDQTAAVIKGKAGECNAFVRHSNEASGTPDAALRGSAQLQSEAALCFNIQAAKERHYTLVRQFVALRDARFGDNGRETRLLLEALQGCGAGSELGSLLVALLRTTGEKFSKLDAAWGALHRAQTGAQASYRKLAGVIEEADRAQRATYRKNLSDALSTCMKVSREAINYYRNNRGILVRGFEWTSKAIWGDDYRRSFEDGARSTERLHQLAARKLSTAEPSYEDLVSGQRMTKVICEGAKIDGKIIPEYLGAASSGGKAIFTILASPIVAVGAVASGGTLLAALGAEGVTATTVLTGIGVGVLKGAAIGTLVGATATMADTYFRGGWENWDRDLLHGSINGAIYGGVGGAFFGGANAITAAAARTSVTVGSEAVGTGVFDQLVGRLAHNTLPAAGTGATANVVIKVKENMLEGKPAFEGTLLEAAYGASVMTTATMVANGVVGAKPGSAPGRIARGACEIGTMAGCGAGDLTQASTVVNILAGGVGGSNRNPNRPRGTATTPVREITPPVREPAATPRAPVPEAPRVNVETVLGSREQNQSIVALGQKAISFLATPEAAALTAEQKAAAFRALGQEIASRSGVPGTDVVAWDFTELRGTNGEYIFQGRLSAAPTLVILADGTPMIGMLGGPMPLGTAVDVAQIRSRLSPVQNRGPPASRAPAAEPPLSPQAQAFRQEYQAAKARAESPVDRNGNPRAPLPLDEPITAPVIVENPITHEKVQVGTSITVKSGGRKVGSLSWDPDPSDPSGKSFVPSIHVEPTAQGREVSRLLLAKALELNPQTERIQGILEQDNRAAFDVGLRQAQQAGLRGPGAIMTALMNTPAYKIRRSLGFGDISSFEIGGIPYTPGAVFDMRVLNLNGGISFVAARTKSLPQNAPPDLHWQQVQAQQRVRASSTFDPTIDSMARNLFDLTRTKAVRDGATPRLVNKDHNVAVADVRVNGRPNETLQAFSGQKKITGTADPIEPEQGRFLVRRPHDAEVKILENLAGRLPRDATGTITLYTERIPCPSCSLLIHSFTRMFPGVKVEIPRLSGWERPASVPPPALGPPTPPQEQR